MPDHISRMIMGCMSQQNKVISNIEMMLSTKPAPIMSFNLMCPLANTMALGGVPLGSMLAQLAPKVIGTPNNNGSICRAVANELTTGAITITCATLLITSLKNTESVVTARIMINTFWLE